MRIRTARKKNKISQAELGKRCNISEQTINKYENGKSIPNAEDLRRLALVLNCDAGWLLIGATKDQNGKINEQKRDYDHQNFCGNDWSETDIQYCRQLKRILDSKDKVAVPAIIANLAALESGIEKNKEIDDLKSGLKKLEKKNEELQSRVVHSEGLDTSAGYRTGTGKAE